MSSGSALAALAPAISPSSSSRVSPLLTVGSGITNELEESVRPVEQLILHLRARNFAAQVNSFHC